MILYDKYVNQSVFTRKRITIERNASLHLSETMPGPAQTTRNIKLRLGANTYDATLYYLAQEPTIQIGYKSDLYNEFRKIFAYSFHYYSSLPNADGADEKPPMQELERITIAETDEPFVYHITYATRFTADEPYNADEPESDDRIFFSEGRKQYRRHVSYERKPALVKLAKKRFKERYGHFFCEICDFDFEKKYGARGRDFIEAHHDIPVSELGENAVTNIADLRMVCSNCHRMLHLQRPWQKAAELRAELEACRSSQR